jgi:predicted nucleic acid-binding Zn ribbon protein
MSFTPFSSLLGKQVAKSAINAAMIVSLAQEAVGDRAKVLSFKNGVLKLNVNSSVEASSLKMNQAVLIAEVNKRLGKEIVSRLTYKVGQ